MADNTTVPVQGTTINYGTVASGTYAGAIGTGNIDEIGGFPQLTADEYDKTRIDQTGLVKQFQASLIDPGTLSLKIGFVKADISANYALIGTRKDWKITFFDGSTLVGTGFIKKIGPEGAKGNEVKCAVDIRCSGPWTFTPAA